MANRNVPVASVVAVLKTQEIDNLIFKRFDNSKILKFARDNDLVLIENNANEILSFTHEVLSSELGGAARGTIITLEIVDPKNKFEANFLSIGYKALYGSNGAVLKEIERLQNAKLSSIPSKISEINKKIDELTKDIESIKPTIQSYLQNPQSYGTVPNSIKVKQDILTDQLKEKETLKSIYAEQIKQLAEIEQKEFLNKVQQEINNLETNAIPSVYFYYGIGPDEKSWAGPVLGNLFNINYQYSGEGSVRKLILQYMPSDSLYSNNKEKFLFKGLGRVANGSAKIYPAKQEAPYSIPKTRFLHETIVDCLQSFIAACAQIPKSNVLILFPYLDEAFRDSLTAHEKAARRTLDSAASNEFFNNLPLGKEKFYEALGFNISSPLIKGTAISTSSTMIGTGMIEQSIEESWETIGSEGFDFSPKTRRDLIFPLFLQHSINLTLEENETFDQVFSNIKNKFIENSTTKFGPIECWWENDPIITDLYRKYSGNSLDSSYPLLIVGDSIFALNYLYGFIGDVAQKDIELKKILTSQVSNFDSWMLNSSYNKEIQNYFYAVEKQFGAFDDLFYNVPDEFSYVDPNLNVKKEQKKPIFKSGYNNSNILEVDINYELSYFKELTHQIVPSLRNVTSTNSIQTNKFVNAIEYLSKAQSKSITEKNIQEFVEKLRLKIISDDKSVLSIKNEFMSEYPFLTEDLGKSFAEQFITIVTNTEKFGMKYLSNEFISKAIINKTAQLIENFTKYSYIANIKTVPFFRLYQTFHAINFPVLLFMREPSLVGSTTKNFRLNDILNGNWNTIGFKHVISDTECYSAFTLIRNPYNSFAPHTLMKKQE